MSKTIQALDSGTAAFTNLFAVDEKQSDNSYKTKHISLADIGSILFPVGSIYLTANSTNPSTSLGFGTWTLVSTGKCIQGATSTSDPNLGKNIDQAMPAINTKITLTGSTGEGGEHEHTFEYISPNGTVNVLNSSTTYSEVQHNRTTRTGTITSSGAHSHNFSSEVDFNLKSGIYSENQETIQPPAFIVCVWQRTK